MGRRDAALGTYSRATSSAMFLARAHAARPLRVAANFTARPAAATSDKSSPPPRPARDRSMSPALADSLVPDPSHSHEGAGEDSRVTAARASEGPVV